MTKEKPKAHKIPTDATVRDLYGTALFCGVPDCKEPLMREVEGTDETILNSTVAHIHARSPKGPRWIEMTEEENRSHDNLIPLCLVHSKEVDHKRLVDKYPAELLREWKRLQLEECKGAKAYVLSDAQVDQVKKESFNSGNVSSEQAIMKVVKSTSIFCSAAKRKVLPISTSAKSWHEVERLGREDRSAWNEDGSFVRLLPSGREAIERKESITNGLSEVLLELNPHADELLAELAALDVLHPEFKEHTNYLAQTIDRLIVNMQISSSDSPWFNYELANELFSDVDTAIERLGAVWRGEDVDELEEEIEDANDIETIASDGQIEFDEWWERHSERVAEGRRYGRATNIEFDIQLFSSLLADAKFLSDMPFSFLERDSFLGTISAATHVLLCASDDDIKTLLQQVMVITPVAVPAILLSFLMENAVKENRLDLIETIETLNESLLLGVNVNEKDFWRDNEIHADRILGYLTAVKSFDEVKAEIANAINGDPELVNLVLPALTPYIDSIDRETGESTLKQTLHSGGGISVLIPIAECINAIQSQYTDIEPHGRFAASRYPEIEKELASQLLEIHNQSQ